jgi:hypothetical protein
LTTLGELGAGDDFHVQHELQVLFLPAAGSAAQGLGRHHQHGVRIGMENARDDGVVFGGAAVARQIGRRPPGGFAIVRDTGRSPKTVHKIPHLIADLVPLGAWTGRKYSKTAPCARSVSESN